MRCAFRSRLPGRALSVLLVVLTVGVTFAHAASSGGGLTVNPALIEHQATVGAVDSIVVANTTSTAQNITITPRPWIATSDGLVTPDLHHDLTQLVGVSRSSFPLAPGASQSVNLTLRKPPPGGSLFAAIVTVGIPVDAAKHAGIAIGYRLVTRLRLDPTAVARKLKVSLSAPRVQGKNIVLPVRNTGNTIEPITGIGQIVSPLGTRNISIAATRILPGASMPMVVTPTKGLKPGKYVLTYTLVQSGIRVGAGKHSVQVN